MTDAFDAADDGIKRLMRDYFDAMHTQDMEKFDNVFHPNCVLYGVVEGQLNIRPYDVYRDVVIARESPENLGNARRDSILDFDQISPEIAWVKPQLEMFGGVMQDYLNLVKLDGKWWIMAKMWARVGDSA